MVTEWISCKERLPEKSGIYLVTICYPEFDNAVHVQTISWSSFYQQWNNFDTSVRNDDEYDAEWKRIITHWMELPEPAEVNHETMA